MVPACLAFFAALACQAEEPLKEAVSVINVEVPVRVFLNGQSVSGLGKEDFQIREDGKSQQINGFYAFRKKINAEIAGASETSTSPKPAGRYFVLIFCTYDFNGQLEKGLRYLFNNILRPEDQVLVMANNRTLMIERLGDDAGAQGRILEIVRSESQAARILMLNYLHNFEQKLNTTKFNLALGDTTSNSAFYIANFLELYLQSWQEFKHRYLSLELDKFYYFSKHLERVRKEKWVLNFYQLVQFPQIAFSGETERLVRGYIDMLQDNENPTFVAQARSIERLLKSIDTEMKVAKDFPAEEASKLFYKVNATFHSFFMHSLHETGNPDLEFRSVATDIEKSLKSLTEATGGTLTASNEIDAALASVSEKTDDCYILTYEPANAKKIGKIKVTVRDKKCDVLYDNNIRADYINDYLKKKAAENPSVKITELSFKTKKLSFVISDFSQAKIKGETAAMLVVRIRIKNAQEQIFFDQSKSLPTAKKDMSLALDFGFLSGGQYDIIVDVLDQVSGKTATEVIQPLVN